MNKLPPLNMSQVIKYSIFNLLYTVIVYLSFFIGKFNTHYRLDGFLSLLYLVVTPSTLIYCIVINYTAIEKNESNKLNKKIEIKQLLFFIVVKIGGMLLPVSLMIKDDLITPWEININSYFGLITGYFFWVFFLVIYTLFDLSFYELDRINNFPKENPVSNLDMYKNMN